MQIPLLFLKIYVLIVSVFTFFRFVLFGVEFGRVKGASGSEIFQAFIMGLRFDLVITSYICALPFAVLSIWNFFTPITSKLKKVLLFFLTLVCGLAFMVSSADIPFFSQFFSRFTVSAFDWFNTPGFVFKMIIEESQYWPYFILYFVLMFVFFKILKKIIQPKKNIERNSGKLYYSLPVFLVFTGLMVLSMRGRLEGKSPIRVGTAFFCNHPFINQLGLNHNFTLIKSYQDKQKITDYHFMDSAKALQDIKHYYGISSPGNSIVRNVNTDFANNQYNVVIVLMESMSAYHLKRDGNREGRVPFLDSLSSVSLYFDNAFSSGIHTHNGIYGTLFSFPAIAKYRAITETQKNKYPAISSVLKSRGYSTMYFTTHDGQFDNIEGFLRFNDYQDVISKKDFPAEESKTNLGVPDDVLFRHGIERLNKEFSKKKPFFSVFLTSSNHPPYYIPEYFKPKSEEPDQQAVEYADWSVAQFLKAAKKQPWYSNTVFVFLGDHGAFKREFQDISLDYVHIPVIFHAPKILGDGKVISNIASQTDIAPTILGILGGNDKNETLGVNLLKEKRKYSLFSFHDKYGVIDEEWLLIYRKEDDYGLYNYKKDSKTNWANRYPDKVAEMKNFLLSNLQFQLDKNIK